MNEFDLYKKMLTIRLLEDSLLDLCTKGEASDLHFNKGQEAISVGTCAALDRRDYVVTHHRTIAHSIAKGIPLDSLVAEILGKSTGICGGRAGEMHLRYPSQRYMFSIQIVGTCVPVSAGLAWAVKNYLREDSIVACFFGEAATANGQFHEGLNIAGVQKVPLLLVCENNGLAGNVRKEFYLPTETVAERALAYGIRATRKDGNHLPEVIEAVSTAAEYVRKNSKPYLLEFETTRLCWHKYGQPDARSKEELADLAKRDPLKFEGDRLGISEKQRATMENEIAAEIRAVVDRARGAPAPSLRRIAS